VPLLLQLGVQLTDVWQPHIQVLALLLLWLRCCGLTTHSRRCSSDVTSVSVNSDPSCTTSLTLFNYGLRASQTACSGVLLTRTQPKVRKARHFAAQMGFLAGCCFKDKSYGTHTAQRNDSTLIWMFGLERTNHTHRGAFRSVALTILVITYS